MLPYVYLIVLWLTFGIAHSLFATAWWKRKVQRLSGAYFPYYRLSYSLFSFFLLIAIVIYEWHLPVVWLWHPGMLWQVIAALPALAGLVIMAICIGRYFFYLSGIDVLFPKRTEQLGLKTGGLNRFVRHPLYAGTLLAVWSCWLVWPELGYLVSCCMITLYTVVGAMLEEKKLQAEFGDAYREYQKRVPMLIPYKWTTRQPGNEASRQPGNEALRGDKAARD